MLNSHLHRRVYGKTIPFPYSLRNSLPTILVNKEMVQQPHINYYLMHGGGGGGAMK